MKKYTLAFAIIGLSTAVLSANSLLSPKTTIKRVFTYKTAAVIELTDAMSKNSGCTYSKSGKYIALRFSDAGAKEMYSSILSAYVAGLKIKMGTSGCDNIWSADGTMNKIYRVTLEK